MRGKAGRFSRLVFTPDMLPNLDAWFDATDSSTLRDLVEFGSPVAPNGAVARWQNKVGNNHLTQSTVANRPLRILDAVNGLDALRFDGVNDVLAAPMNSNLVRRESTVFVVAKATVVPSDLGGHGIGNNASALANSLPSHGVFVVRQNGTVSAYVDTSLATTDVPPDAAVASFAYIPGNWAFMSAWHDDGMLQASLNGGETVTPSNNGSSLGFLQLGNIVVGRGSDVNNGRFFRGDIVEIISYGRVLTDAERAAVESYIVSKYGAFSMSFSPSLIPGLTGWWDASDVSTLFNNTSGGSPVAADGAVARLEDKSGNGRHFRQSSTGSRPVRKTSVVNGLDVLRFDGASDSMQMDFSVYSDIQPAAESSIFIVAKAAAVDTDFSVSYANDAVFSASDAHTAFALSSSNKVFVIGYDSTHRSVELSYAAGDWIVLSSWHDGTSLYAQKNNESAVSTSLSTRSFTNSSPNLGVNFNAKYFDGDFGEMLTFNVALSESDRANVISYLTEKWGIA